MAFDYTFKNICKKKILGLQKNGILQKVCRRRNSNLDMFNFNVLFQTHKNHHKNHTDTVVVIIDHMRIFWAQFNLTFGCKSTFRSKF